VHDSKRANLKEAEAYSYFFLQSVTHYWFFFFWHILLYMIVQMEGTKVKCARLT
jgi:hypothetical protein